MSRISTRPERFHTLARAATAEIVINKSRFIAHAAPVRTEDEARAVTEAVRSEHAGATHNVFAYQIGLHAEVQRMSDDGEPSGTAGRPVLEALQKHGLKDSVIVVTRYFGGIKLGAGGLVRAYARSAREGVAAAGVREKWLHARFSASLDYGFLRQTQYLLEQQPGVQVLDTAYTDRVIFDLALPLAAATALKEALTGLTHGEIVLTDREETYL